MSINKHKYHVQILSNSAKFHEEMHAYLREDFQIININSPEKSLAVINDAPNDTAVVICDNNVHPNNTALHYLSDLKRMAHTQVVFCFDKELDPNQDVSSVVALTKLGAFDCIQTPTFKKLICWITARAIENFHLTLHLLKDKNTADQQALTTPAITNKNIAKGIHVLIVDDEDNFRRSIDMLLEPYGYNLHEASSGKAALETLTSTTIDIVLLDVALGDTTGDLLVKDIKALSPETEIIMVTAYKDIELIVNTISEGAYDYVVKGEWVNTLPNKMANALLMRNLKKGMKE